MWDLQWSFRLDNIFYTEEKEYKIFWKIDRGKNMVDVYLLKAKEGDCLFVRYGNENEMHNILIDGGCAECGHTVERIIKQCDNNNEKIDLVVVTHVDEDHIGGLITGFASVNEEILKRSIQRIAFNTSRGFLQHNKLNGKIRKTEEAVKVIVCEGDGCSIGDAKSLCDIINEKGLKCKLEDYIVSGTEMIIGNAKLTILSPDEQSLSAFMNKWEEENNCESAGGCSNEFPEEIYKDLTALKKEKYPGADASLSNRASIAFLFEYEDVKILFLGDAAAPIYTKELKKYMKNEKISIDVVKMSHHGSSRSISKRFLDSIDAEVFMVSSNGTTLKGQHTVPGKIAIAKLLNRRNKVILLNNYCWCKYAYQNQYFTINDIREYFDTKLLELYKISDNPYMVKEGLNIYGEFKPKKIIS